MSRHSFVAAALAAGLAGAGPAAAQIVPPVHIVGIDAIAVDARGVPIGTLAPSDFELREGGKVLAVERAEFVRDIPRVVAVYLDEYNISPGASADRARTALAQFVERELGPRDQLVVMKPLDSVLAIRLGTERDSAQRAIQTLEGRKGDLSPRTDYERAHMAGSAQRIEAARAQVAISALNALAMKLGTVNGFRKTLLVVSERLDRAPRRRGFEHLATVDAVVRSANRAHVSIYPIDPRVPSDDASTDDVLAALAKDTAGRVVAAATELDDLHAGLRSIAAESSAYYMLSYRSAHHEDGRFHPVEIRVKRPAVQLRARAGYWAPSADDRLRADVIERASRPPVVVPPEPARRNSALIRPWFGLSKGGDDRMRVTFVWEPAPAVPGVPARAAAARLELTVLTDDDVVLFQGAVLPAGRSAAPADGPSRAVFETVPGRLRLRMKIQDVAQRDVDSDVRDLLVRDLRGRVAIGTPQVMRARTAREFRALEADSQGSPVSSRIFSRAERILVRFPAYGPEGQPPTVTARLLNRLGQPMRPVEVRSKSGGGHELDLLLSGLASGEYHLELEARTAAGRVTERLEFRVTS